MTLDAARALARALLSEHGLHDWTFAFNRRKRAFGVCDFGRRAVYLSSTLTELNDEASVACGRPDARREASPLPPQRRGQAAAQLLSARLPVLPQ